MFNDSTLPIECRLPNVEAVELVKFILYHDNAFNDIFTNLAATEENMSQPILDAAVDFLKSILKAHEECYSEAITQEAGKSLLMSEQKRDSAAMYPAAETTLREVEAQLLLQSLRTIVEERKRGLITRSLEACMASSESEVTKLTKIIDEL